MKKKAHITYDHQTRRSEREGKRNASPRHMRYVDVNQSIHTSPLSPPCSKTPTATNAKKKCAANCAAPTKTYRGAGAGWFQVVGAFVIRDPYYVLMSTLHGAMLQKYPPTIRLASLPRTIITTTIPPWMGWGGIIIRPPTNKERQHHHQPLNT